jgi:ParB-like chromosome segregation protein Spo0J
MPVDEPMAHNMRVYGNKDACKVRKNGRYPDGHPLAGEDIIEVVDGRQRARSCRLAHQLAKKAGEVGPMLKVELEKVDDKTAAGIMISLNEHRRDDLPSVKARKAARVLAMGHSEESVAAMFGVTTAAIRQWGKFAELSSKVVKAVDAGKVSFSAALAFHGLSRDEQSAKLDELLASGAKPTVQNAKATANGGKPTPAARAPKIFTPKIVRKLHEDESWIGGLSPDAQALFRVLCGDQGAIKRVPGLAERLKID